MFADGYERKITVELWSAMIADDGRWPSSSTSSSTRRPGASRRGPGREAGRSACERSSDGIGWLLTADNWRGTNGIGQPVVQHLWYSLLATVAAIVIALPIGLAIGHTGRGRFVAANVSRAAGGRSRPSAS